MPLRYHAGFDVAKLGAFSVVVGGIASGTASLPSATYCHVALSSVLGAGEYTQLAAAVQTALRTVHPNFVCTFNTSTLRYTISNPSGNFTLTWSGDAGARLRAALGFAGNVTSTSSATGTVTPHYVIDAKIEGRSMDSDVYEPADIVEESVADGGSSFAVSKETVELWRDWQQAMETLESTMSRRAASAAPWTWQHFFRHCRGDQPFLVAGDTPGKTGAIYKLRAQGASFSDLVRRRVTSDYDGLWNIQFYTRDLGELA